MAAPVLRGRMKLDTGFRRSPADIRDIRYGFVARDGVDVPESYSFDTPRRQLPVYDQGQVPKCTCSASSLLKTAQERVEENKTFLFDDDELYSHVELPGGGAYIRDVLQFLVDSGATPVGKKQRRKIKLYAAIDPKNHDEVKHAMVTAGVLVVGFEVPRSFLKGGGKEFDAAGAKDDDIVGRHAIVASSYGPLGPGLQNSWGPEWMDNGRTQVSWEFWDRYVDEVWSTVDATDPQVAENLSARKALNLFTAKK